MLDVPPVPEALLIPTIRQAGSSNLLDKSLMVIQMDQVTFLSLFFEHPALKWSSLELNNGIGIEVHGLLCTYDFPMIVTSTWLLTRILPGPKLHETRFFALGKVLRVCVTEMACMQEEHNALFTDTLD